jgi:Tfp pilus assembly protein PilX
MPNGQRGTALFVALISLVVMTLGAFALVRSIDTSTVIAGNVGFKQAALISTDASIEDAITWISSNAGLLNADSSANGYYATEQANLDIKGTKTPLDPTDDVDWDGNNNNTSTKPKTLTKDYVGNTVAFVINRLCRFPGSINDPNQSCFRFAQDADPGLSTRSGPAYGQGPQTQPNQTYYRITARVKGPRNTTTFVQAIVVI